MSIVSCNSTNEKNVSRSIANFISVYGIISLLTRCGCAKIKGVSVKELFIYIVTNVFHAGSFYMQQKADNIQIAFSKNTYYRFLTNPHVNWLRFVTSLSEKIINNHIRPLTSESRDDCFVIGDSLYERVGYKKTELASLVFDHVSMKFKHGYRLLTLGWTDGCTLLPINFSLQASAKEENVLGPHGNVDKITLAGKRRFMACSKSTDVMVELLRTALSSGHRAKYVLFDSWFSNPSQISAIKDLGMNVIAMVKRSSKRTYLFEGKQLDIKKIFVNCKNKLPIFPNQIA